MVEKLLFNEGKEFQARLLLAERNSEPGGPNPFWSSLSSDPAERKVKPGEFVGWLIHTLPGDYPPNFHSIGSTTPVGKRDISVPGVSDGPLAVTSSSDSVRSAALRPGSNDKIRKTIEEVYTHAETRGLQPPNIKLIGKIVSQIMRQDGYEASQVSVRAIADEDVYKTRRSRSGVKASFPAFSLESFRKAGPEA